jgi:hypothetical protein
MSRIFVDRALAGTPGSAEALRHLTDAGHEIVPVDASPALELVREATRRRRTAWLLAGSTELCAERPPGLMTVFVGPRRAQERGPVVRCDIEARDITAAVLEILSREAMGRALTDR